MTDIIQAAGSQASISFWEESTYNTTPGSPVMYQLAAVVEGATLKATVEKLVSKAVSNGRGVASARGGNIDVSGDVPFEMPIAGFARLLKHAVGTGTTYRAVSQAGDLTGITAQYANNATPTGAGTLTLSGSSLTWQASGDGSAGAAVNVAAAGTYTLQSGSANHELIVISTGTVGGATAAVTVSSTFKTHVLKRGALPVGLGFEIAYPDVSTYHVFTGCRINKISFKVGNSGFVTGTMSIVGAGAAINTSPLGTPVAYTHVPYVHHEAVFTEAGVAANVTDISIDLDNEIDPGRCVGSRYVATTKEGKGNLSGKATYLFAGADQLNRVLNETEQDFRISLFATGAYAGHKVDFHLPKTKAFGDAGVGIPTAKGLVISLDLQATKDAALGSDIVVTITSTEQTI